MAESLSIKYTLKEAAQPDYEAAVSQWVGASQVAQWVKHLPATQETQVQFLGREDPLEESMATHSRILAWRIPWTRGA